jgi:phage shock protein A
MVFGFFKRKPRPPADPLAVFDGAIEAAERDAGELRRSAATLLAQRGMLERDGARLEAERGAVEARLDEALRAGDVRAARLLEADLQRTGLSLAAAREALARVSADAELLVEGARETSARVEALRAERASAHARLLAGQAAGSAMQAEGARRVDDLKLDRARDEVERARALAELWREDRRPK